MRIGSVLGQETARETQRLVEGILSQAWEEQFSTRDMRIMVVAVGVLGIIVAIQVMHYFLRKSNKINHQWWRWPVRAFVDVLIFVTLVIGQIYLQAFIEKVRAPRAIQYARVVPQILSVSYRTYDPNYSIINWGYDPLHLDYVELGAAAGNKSLKHDFNIAVQASSPVYFRILANGEFYGQKQLILGEPYQINGELIENKK